MIVPLLELNYGWSTVFYFFIAMVRTKSSFSMKHTNFRKCSTVCAVQVRKTNINDSRDLYTSCPRKSELQNITTDMVLCENVLKAKFSHLCI